MEGVGSRVGRASSRYGPSSTTAVFNGPVRKWKRKWVHVSPPPSSNNNNSSSSSTHSSLSNSHNLLLRRWTPLSSSSPDEQDDSPKRKFRYTPVAVLEEQKKAAAKKVEVSKGGDSKQSPAESSESGDTNDEVTKRDDSLLKEIEDSNTALDLGLFLKGHNSDQDVDQSEKGQMNQASSGRLWTTEN